MATIIRYDGISIYDVLTESIEQSVEMDKSGANPLYRRTTITVTGIVYLLANTSTSTDPLGITISGGLSSNIDNIIKTLSRPQQTFYYFIDGTAVWTVFGKGSASRGTALNDIKNGPITHAKLLHIVGNKSARIEFSVTFWTKACGDNSQRNNTDIVSLKFWQMEDINENWFATRTYRGHLVVSRPDIGVHSFQGWVLPPLIRGFMRNSMNFSESPDGLTLDFTIVDRQVYAYPPFPAVSWRGQHSVIFPTEGANKAESEYRLSVNGPPYIAKEELFKVCYNILVAKLYLNDVINEGGDLIQYIRFDEDITTNSISAHAKVMHTNLANLLGNRRTFLKPLDPKFNGDFPHPVKSAGLRGIFAQALYKDPCTAIDPWSKPLQQDYGVGEDGTNKNYPKEKKKSGDKQNGAMPSEDVVAAQNRKGNTSTPIYYLSSTIDVQENLVQYPVSSFRGSENYITRITAPTAKRIIDIEASRINEYPIIPAKKAFRDMNNIMNYPQVWQPELQLPQISADGRKTLYSINMHIEYLMARAPRLNEKLPSGHPPYIANNVATNYLGPELQLTPGNNYPPIS